MGIIAAIIHFYVYNYIETTGRIFYNESDTDVPKLYDAIHENFCHIPINSDWMALFIAALFPILCIIIQPSMSIYIPFIKLTLAMFIPIFITRDIFLMSTILPKDESCTVQDGFQLTGGCYDKMFSGHFAFGYALSLLYYKFNIITNIPLLVLLNILNAFIIICSKSHYTIDVLTSFIVVTLIFKIVLENEIYLLD